LGLSAFPPIKIATRFVAVYARVATGHAAAQPSPAMKARRVKRRMVIGFPP
jgi:hypothetical protein